MCRQFVNNSQENKVIGTTLKLCCLKLPPAAATGPAKCSLKGREDALARK